MSRLEMAGAIAFAAVAIGAKWLEERSRTPVAAVQTPPTALVPVVGQTPGTSSWAPILAFLAPLAVGVGVWAARLWGAQSRALEEQARIASAVALFNERQSEFMRLLGAIRGELDGFDLRLEQLERREDGRDARAAQAERARDQRARRAEVQRDQTARAADERRDRRAEQLEARRTEGYVNVLAHNTRELARVLAEERAKLDKMNDHIRWMQELRCTAPTATEARALTDQIVDAKNEVQAIYDDLDYLSSLR